MTPILCVIFLVSGTAALLFETLWFRQAGLALGNTVWASALVTASFMAGLAIGNGFAVRWSGRVASPLRVYAALEVVVALSGVGLVLVFPLVGHLLAPLMGSLGAQPLDALRVVVSFGMLLLPSCAMGTTLPLLAGALSRHDANFGRILGQLYGWNTFGAVLGTLAGDLLLVEAIGIRRAALVAAFLNLVAAAGAVALAGRIAGQDTAVAVPSRVRLRSGAWRVLVAAFLSGGILLALEVVWFRFLLAFTPASAWTFAVLLAVVLFGIATGGLVASVLLGWRPDAHRWAPLAAVAAGVGVVWSYATFVEVAPSARDTLLTTLGDYFAISLPLMFPVSFLSGLLFPLLGRALHAQVANATRATGLVTLANTTGAMLGALAAGFMLLPMLGVERSLFGLACGYGVVALLSHDAEALAQQRILLAVAGALLLTAVVLFPFGLMLNRYVPLIASRWQSESYRPIAFAEGVTETVMLLRQDAFDRPLAHRLVTNGMAMSGTTYVGRRYMGLYAWWPVAVHPAPRTALLISYGLGTTARALVETRELERIDVVDVSRDVLRLSALAQDSPASNPLADPRVHVHVEDGRFFLLTTPARYDIVTAEPPPPRVAGIASLYSREFFALARSRLRDGGVVTYWLPVYQLEPREMRAIVGAFCAVFEDCSLWSGYLLDWMLVGTRDARGPVSAERFRAQWRDPVVAERLQEAGLDDPALLGASFLADAPVLRQLVAGAPELDDEHPYRISPRVRTPYDIAPFVQLMQIDAPQRRFFESELVRRLWPEPMRDAARAAFLAQDAMNAAALGDHAPAGSGLSDLDRLLTKTALRAPVLWALGTSVAEVRLARAAVARGEDSPMAEELIGLDALARRDYGEADRRLGLAESHAAHAPRIRMWRVLGLGLAGDKTAAARLLASAPELSGFQTTDRAPWTWLARRLELPDPIVTAP
jgi:spermidine synthase